MDTAKQRLIELCNVSRETLEKLETYEKLLLEWSEKINLVGKSTLPILWDRHFLDSAQIFPHISPQKNKKLLDLGSGAGFPGMVLAVLGMGDVYLLESDGKKCLFLENVSRETFSPVQIINKRIENVAGLRGDLITSRALAPLSQLLEYCYNFMTEQTVAYLWKGQSWQTELTDAQKTWKLQVNPIPSITSDQSVILQITGVKRVKSKR